jgi:hypothetical protein
MYRRGLWLRLGCDRLRVEAVHEPGILPQIVQINLCRDSCRGMAHLFTDIGPNGAPASPSRLPKVWRRSWNVKPTRLVRFNVGWNQCLISEEFFAAEPKFVS